eukprot:6491564-Amphidinium_carterae.1
MVCMGQYTQQLVRQCARDAQVQPIEKPNDQSPRHAWPQPSGVLTSKFLSAPKMHTLVHRMPKPKKAHVSNLFVLLG